MSSGWQIELSASGLPHLSGGRYYQAWLKNSAGVLVPIGTFNDALKVTLWSGVPVTQFRTLTVTRQQANGNPASSGQRVLIGTIKSPGLDLREPFGPTPRTAPGAQVQTTTQGEVMGTSRRTSWRRARVAAASVVLALATAGSAAAAFQALPPGAQVNDDPAAGINKTLSVSGEDPTNADVVGGALTAGKPAVPWAIFRQQETAGSARSDLQPLVRGRRVDDARQRHGRRPLEREPRRSAAR